MIRVVAVITANPGRREEVLSVFRANVPAVRAEKGCIEYAAHIDTADVGPLQAKFGPDTFVVLEILGKPGGAAGSRRRASHEDLRATNQGFGRQPGNSHSVFDRLGSARPRFHASGGASDPSQAPASRPIMIAVPPPRA